MADDTAGTVASEEHAIDKDWRCPVCRELILRRNTAKNAERAVELPVAGAPPSKDGAPVLHTPPGPFLEVESMMAFENVGVSKPSKERRYVTCANWYALACHSTMLID